MTSFEIRQEPGPAAKRSAGRFGARAKRVGLLHASDEPAALLGFIRVRYPAGHAQYVSHRLEWQSSSASGNRWHEDDRRHGQSGRRYRAVVALANGRYAHDVVLVAGKVAS